jgi:hypothetical protein
MRVHFKAEDECGSPAAPATTIPIAPATPFPLPPLPCCPCPHRCCSCCPVAFPSSCMSSHSSSLVLLFSIVCARPATWLRLFDFGLCLLALVCAHSAFVCAHLAFVHVHLGLFVLVQFSFALVFACPAIHLYLLIWLSFGLVRVFRAFALLLHACSRLLRARLGLFRFVWAHLSVSNTHLVHRS